VDDDTGVDLAKAPGDPGADATGRPGHEGDASAEVQELRERAPCSTHPSYREMP
jgi:hypothetical protein